MKNRNESWNPKWVALPILDFVREIRRFGSDCEAGFQWVRKFADDLLLCNFDTDDEFTRGLLMEAKERYMKRSAAGKLGGRPSTRSPAIRQPAATNLPSKEQLYDFAAEQGLDETVAREWYEMTIVDRGGLDRNGDPILNWKGACKRFCTARAKARNKNGENQ